MEKSLFISICSPVARTSKGKPKYQPWPGMNEYQRACRANKYAGADFKNTYTLIAQMTSAVVAIKRHWVAPESKCHVHFVWREPHTRRDPDNIQSGAKFVLDGLVAGGVLKDDSQQYINMPTHSMIIDKENPGVNVIVSLIEEDDEQCS